MYADSAIWPMTLYSSTDVDGCYLVVMTMSGPLETWSSWNMEYLPSAVTHGAMITITVMMMMMQWSLNISCGNLMFTCYDIWYHAMLVVNILNQDGLRWINNNCCLCCCIFVPMTLFFENPFLNHLGTVSLFRGSRQRHNSSPGASFEMFNISYHDAMRDNKCIRVLIKSS